MKLKRRGILISISLLLIIPILYFISLQHIDYFIERLLKNQDISITSKGLFFDPWTQSLTAEHLELSLPELGSVTCTNLKINRIALTKLILSLGYGMKDVTVDSLSIVVNNKKDTSATNDHKSNLKHFYIDHLSIKHGQFNILNKTQHIQSQFTTKELSIDSQDGIDKGLVSAKHFSIESFEPANLFHVDSLIYNFKNRGLIAKQLSFSSTLNDHAYKQKFPYQKDKVNVELSQLGIRGIDINPLKPNNVFKFDKVELSSLNLNVSKDKTLPEQPTVDKSLITDMVRLIPLSFSADTVTLINSVITYNQHFENSKKGKITFDKLYASIYDLSNIKKNTIYMDAQARFQDAGTLQTHFEFNPSPASNLVSGELSEMDMTVINQITVPSGLSIESGQLLKLNFDFSYTDQTSKGTIDMQYQNLSIKRVDDETDRPGLLELEAFLANTFIIRTHNLKSKSNYRQGTIEIERNLNKRDIAYWLQSLLDGVKSTIGINKQV